ncbi:MAG TPA: NUDIX hydrolase [Candidatus Dormibacteraeota bacterium]|nr:NUDIX hydrolase [Candidatus Dormibacteraeota bacterium]
MSDDRLPRTILSEVPWSGRIMSVHVDRLELPNGAVVEREAVRHPKVSAVVAIDADRCILMVREYRHPAGRTFLQIPSGLREPGEEAEDCARRELMEETGFACQRLERLIGLFPSPGVSDEWLDVFLATDLHRVGSPLPEGEQGVLELVVVPLEEAVSMAASGRLLDAKTVIAVLLAGCRMGVDPCRPFRLEGRD